MNFFYYKWNNAQSKSITYKDQHTGQSLILSWSNNINKPKPKQSQQQIVVARLAPSDRAEWEICIDKAVGSLEWWCPRRGETHLDGCQAPLFLTRRRPPPTQRTEPSRPRPRRHLTKLKLIDCRCLEENLQTINPEKPIEKCLWGVINVLVGDDILKWRLDTNHLTIEHLDSARE